jgi:hypothetical protein
MIRSAIIGGSVILGLAATPATALVVTNQRIETTTSFGWDNDQRTDATVSFSRTDFSGPFSYLEKASKTATLPFRSQIGTPVDGPVNRVAIKSGAAYRDGTVSVNSNLLSELVGSYQTGANVPGGVPSVQFSTRYTFTTDTAAIFTPRVALSGSNLFSPGLGFNGDFLADGKDGLSLLTGRSTLLQAGSYTYSYTILGSFDYGVVPLGNAFANLDLSIAAVPEPGMWLMMISGFGATGMMLRRRNGRRPSRAGQRLPA